VSEGGLEPADPAAWIACPAADCSDSPLGSGKIRTRLLAVGLGYSVSVHHGGALMILVKVVLVGVVGPSGGGAARAG
jgi:hypothetical protein